jgi:hypothetical protein
MVGIRMKKPQLQLERIGEHWRGKCPLCDEVLQVPKDFLFRDAIAQQAKLNADFDFHITNIHGLGNKLFE